MVLLQHREEPTIKNAGLNYAFNKVLDATYVGTIKTHVRCASKMYDYNICRNAQMQKGVLFMTLFLAP